MNKLWRLIFSFWTIAVTLTQCQLTWEKTRYLCWHFPSCQNTIAWTSTFIPGVIFSRCLLVAERSNEVCLINDVTTQQHAVHCMINTETLDIRKAARLYITLVSPALITLWSLLLAEWNRMNVYDCEGATARSVLSTVFVNKQCLWALYWKEHTGLLHLFWTGLDSSVKTLKLHLCTWL